MKTACNLYSELHNNFLLTIYQLNSVIDVSLFKMQEQEISQVRICGCSKIHDGVSIYREKNFKALIYLLFHLKCGVYPLPKTTLRFSTSIQRILHRKFLTPTMYGLCYFTGTTFLSKQLVYNIVSFKITFGQNIGRGIWARVIRGSSKMYGDRILTYFTFSLTSKIIPSISTTDYNTVSPGRFATCSCVPLASFLDFYTAYACVYP